MKENALAVLHRAISESLVALFDHYSPTPTHVKPLDDNDTVEWLAEQMNDPATAEMVSASIGLGGDDFRASVGLLTHVSTSVGLFEGGDVCPIDWTGELSNQLIGRVKNVLSEYDVAANMGMPVSVRGIAMGFNFSTTNQQVFAVTTSAGRVICVLNTEMAPELEWEYSQDLAAADEGSLCLF